MTRKRNRSIPSTPRPIAELVSEVYPAREPEDVAVIRAFAWWRKAVPQRIFMRARPVRLANGVLYVNTATTAWASELDHMKEQLLLTIHKQAHFVKVRDLRFRVGPLPESPRPTRPESRRASPIVLASIPEKLARVLSQIDDDALRDVIGAAASVALGRHSER